MGRNTERKWEKEEQKHRVQTQSSDPSSSGCNQALPSRAEQPALAANSSKSPVQVLLGMRGGSEGRNAPRKAHIVVVKKERRVLHQRPGSAMG